MLPRLHKSVCRAECVSCRAVGLFVCWLVFGALLREPTVKRGCADDMSP